MLNLVGSRLSYHLSLLEKLGAFGNSPSVDISNLLSVTREEDPWTTKVLRGIRFPGTGFPFVIMLGTLLHRNGKDFCVVYKRRPVLVLEFKNEKHQRWIIPATPDSEELLSKVILNS